MKRLIFPVSFLLLIITSSYAQSGWFWQNPFPQGNDLKAIKFFNSDVGFAVGYNGTIMKTINKGINWSIQYITNNKRLNYVLPLDLNIIIACGDSGEIAISKNGGTQWQIQNSGTNKCLNQLFFINVNTGFCVGNNSVVLKTTNQGNNWVNTLSGNRDINSVFFINNDTGIIGGTSVVYKTTNLGSNWVLVYDSSFTFNDFYYINSNTGFAAGSTFYPNIWGCILKTSNGGMNWTSVKRINTNYPFIKLDFNNSGTGFSTAFDTVFKTTNYGISWNPTFLCVGNSYLDLIGNNVFIAGQGGSMYMSSDYGGNWSNLATPYHLTAYKDISKFYASVAYIVGSDSSILKTTNNGQNWFSIKGPARLGYYSCFFTSAESGYLVNGFNIYKTINGGLNWYSIFSYTTGHPFLSIFFSNENTGYVGTYSSTIYKTTNAGVNWELKFNDATNGDITQIDFPNEQTGYAVNNLYGLRKTTNQGNNWYNPPIISNTINFKKIQFFNSSTGYLMGMRSYANYNHVILKTTDGGLNWTESFSIPSPYFYLQSFNFSNNGIGYAVGDYGRIYRTSNWGATWYQQYSITNNELLCVLSYNDTIAYAAGLKGTVIKTTNSGGAYIGINLGIMNIPSSFSLSQNYPNPFNPSTTIKFSLPLPSKGGVWNVKIIIYDILGREIDRIIPPLGGGQEGLKPGTYEVVWDGSNYPSGVYFYQLITNDYTESKKMILLK